MKKILLLNFGFIFFATIINSSLASDAHNSSVESNLGVFPFELTLLQNNGSVAITNKQIVINAHKGTDLFTNPSGSESKANFPGALFLPEGDFIFSSKVSAKFSDTPYDGGALVVFSNDRVWAKLLFERFKSGQLGVATTISNPNGDDSYHATFTSNEIFLKIVRYDTSYVFYTSEDGEQWNFVRHFDLGKEVTPRIGFIAQSPVADSFTATFSEVSFQSKRISDFWQGN